MSKMSNVVKTVAVIAIATVIGRSVGYFTGTRMAASSQTASSTSSTSNEADSSAASQIMNSSANSDVTSDSSTSDSSTSETAIATPATDSLLIEHRVFKTDDTAEHPEYIVIFYESGSKKLVQLNDETLFYKSAGYTLESIQGIDVSQVYPGVENFDFMTKEVTDEGDYIRYVLAFNNLEKNENLKALDGAGIIVLDDGFTENNYVNAETLCQSMIDSGRQELKLTEMPDSLTYTVNE